MGAKDTKKDDAAATRTKAKGKSKTSKKDEFGELPNGTGRGEGNAKTTRTSKGKADATGKAKTKTKSDATGKAKAKTKSVIQDSENKIKRIPTKAA